MRYLRTGPTLLFLIWMLLFIASCKRATERSQGFITIFRPESGGTFRGMDLGMSLDKVKELEGTTPKHDDQWGYVYQFPLMNGGKFYVEYVCRIPEKRTLNSIVVNIFLEEKGEASDLFAEIEHHLRDRYGVADGSLGRLNWRHEESNLIVALRMLDDKLSISLNYGALEPA